MDKATVKLLLESYRPHSANDPIFAEALREVAADPELAAWFGQMQRFDAVMSAKFQQLPVPSEVKDHILLCYTASVSPRPRRSRAMIFGAIAAALVLGLICWNMFAPPRRGGDALALEAISYTDKMPPLQFVCFDAAVVAEWINQQPVAKQIGISLGKPPASLSMAMIGSSVVYWNGRPVIMICLQNGKRMAMLYILSDSYADDLKEGARTTIQKADWVVRTTKTAGQVRLLTTKGRPEDLDFQMPF
jgi:hypothetical protein